METVRHDGRAKLIASALPLQKGDSAKNDYLLSQLYITLQERKAFVHELNHSQSVYHRNYEDKHRERGKKRYFGSEFRGER